MKDIAAFWSDNDLTRFWSKVIISTHDECWIWTAGKQKGGYGNFKFAGRKIGAHRFSLMVSSGMLDSERYACHTCDNPPCVNPKHLFWGSPSDNNSDTVSKGRWQGGNALKTHCKNGHRFSKENTRIRKCGGRSCIACEKKRNLTE